MKDTLISHEDIRALHPIFRGRYGEKIIDIGMKLAALDVPNEIYNSLKHLNGHAFSKGLLDKLEIKRRVENADVLEGLKHRSFITVSNHSYGHVDGIALIETMGSRVQNWKIMVNFILGMVDTLSDYFITVNPYKNREQSRETMAGIKESLTHLKEGNPLGFFPAGAISNLYFKKGKFIIEDRKWQPAVIKIINRAKVPVIPIHISGYNSLSFYLSRIFGWQARTLRLCHEFNNKRGKEMVLTFGEPIMPDKIEEFNNDLNKLGDFLRVKTYALR